MRDFAGNGSQGKFLPAAPLGILLCLANDLVHFVITMAGISMMGKV